MKSYVSLRVLTRLFVTSLAVLMVILLINESKRRLANNQPTYQQVDINRLHSMCGGSHVQMQDICACPRSKRSLFVQVPDGEQVVMSTCDSQATARGFNQTVVSYSFYGNVTSDYFLGIKRNVFAIRRMYPAYVMRVYHDLDVATDDVASKALCKLWCDNDHLDFCDVRRLPYGLCDQHHIFGMVWRFFVLGDPLVDRFLIRDIDGDIIEREVDSVNEWIAQGMTWHIMRDHPFHSTAILGGMWGGTNNNLTMTTALRKTLIEHGHSSTSRGHDQNILTTFLWPFIQDDMVSHDSYLCQFYFGAKPWPTRRTTKDFVGNKFPWKEKPEFTIDVECPIECRPKEHQDWTYC